MTMMAQKAAQAFISKCGKAQTFVENDMPIGAFHDYLMELKGLMVDRMIAAHKEQLGQAEAMKKQDEAPPSCEGQACPSKGE